MPSSSWFHLEHRGTHCVPLSRDPLRGLSRRWSVDRGLKILSFLKCKLCYCLSALIIECCKMVQKLSSKNLQKVCPKIVKKKIRKRSKIFYVQILQTLIINWTLICSTSAAFFPPKRSHHQFPKTCFHHYLFRVFKIFLIPTGNNSNLV